MKQKQDIWYMKQVICAMMVHEILYVSSLIKGRYSISNSFKKWMTALSCYLYYILINTLCELTMG